MSNAAMTPSPSCTQSQHELSARRPELIMTKPVTEVQTDARSHSPHSQALCKVW